MKNLLTYKDASLICQKHDNFHFSEKMYMIEGYKISSFSYFMCDYNKFKTPIKDLPYLHAFDMRGMTFVFDRSGLVWRRYLMLPKFFNLNQVEDTQFKKVIDKEVSYITEKEDGSLVAFMGLPNGNIFSKTISGFSNEMSVAAMNIANNDKNLYEWIKRETIDRHRTPLFEYVSWDNRIVLNYNSKELRFIGLRDNKNGELLLSPEVTDPPPVKSIKPVNHTLYDVLELAKHTQDKEGWVIKFKDGQLMKVKTAWYFDMHKLRTDNVFREDYVIRNYLQETLDDVLSQLDPELDRDAHVFVKRVTRAVDMYMKKIDEKVRRLERLYTEEYDKDWNKFAKERHKEAFFGLARNFINDHLYKDKKVEHVLKLIQKLSRARDLVERNS